MGQRDFGVRSERQCGGVRETMWIAVSGTVSVSYQSGPCGVGSEGTLWGQGELWGGVRGTVWGGVRGTVWVGSEGLCGVG